MLSPLWVSSEAPVIISAFLLLCVEHCFRFSYLKALIYFIPGIEGGQGNNDAIYGSHDDHDTFGVLGEGWQGPGNGEDILDLYNPGT